MPNFSSSAHFLTYRCTPQSTQNFRRNVRNKSGSVNNWFICASHAAKIQHIVNCVYYIIEISINGLSTGCEFKNVNITTEPQHPTKLKHINRFGDKSRVNSSNFKATILKFSEKFDNPFLHVFIFGNMFPASQGFVDVPVTRPNDFVCVTN